MNKYRIGFIITIALVLLVSYLLVAASPVLEWVVIEDPYVPFGNILTWIGVIALPLTMYLGVKRLRSPETKLDSFYRIFIIAAIVLGILWYPVAWFLADNFSGSFGGSNSFRGSTLAGEYFWNYSYLVVGLPLLLLITYGISRILSFLIK